MNDCFTLLNEPRRPWLDPELLKQKFLTLSSQFHPDRVHSEGEAGKKTAQQHFSELNAAYNRLRDPKERLLHLLELELGVKPPDVQRIPPALIGFFEEVNRSCRDADRLLQEKSNTTSPLLKVKMFDRGQECTDLLSGLQRRINSEREMLLADIRMIDSGWETSSVQKTTLKRLEDIYRLLSYYTRWGSQLQERIVQLSF